MNSEPVKLPAPTYSESSIRYVQRRQGLLLIVFLLFLVLNFAAIIHMVLMSRDRTYYFNRLTADIGSSYQTHTTITAEYKGEYTAVWGENISEVGLALGSYSDIVIPPRRKPKDLESTEPITLYISGGDTYTIYPQACLEADDPRTATYCYIRYHRKRTSIWVIADYRSAMSILLEACSPGGIKHANALLKEKPSDPLTDSEIYPLLPAEAQEWMDAENVDAEAVN